MIDSAANYSRSFGGGGGGGGGFDDNNHGGLLPSTTNDGANPALGSTNINQNAGGGFVFGVGGDGNNMISAATQSSAQVINSMHLDYIHHVAFDTYGRRMATCSGDRFVRVWELTAPTTAPVGHPSATATNNISGDSGKGGENGTNQQQQQQQGQKWVLAAQWQAHRGAVTSLSWAHPEFGSLLATCGTDHDAKIWEERSVGTGSGGGSSLLGFGVGPGASVAGSAATVPAGVAGGGGAGLVSNPSVGGTAAASISFSGHPSTNTVGSGSSFANVLFPGQPSGVGVMGVAAGPGGAAAGGGSSAIFNSRWTTRASLTEARRAVSCLEFAPRHWGLKLAVGSADGCVRIYEAVDIMNLAQWPLAATLQSFDEAGSSGSVGGGDGGGGRTSAGAGPGVGGAGAGGPAGTSYHHKSLGCTCLSWCTGRFEPPTLVVGGTHLVIYRYSENARAWQAILKLPPPSPQSSSLHYQGDGGGSYDVLDVIWAPNVGRRYHYIASAEDRQLRIYKLSRGEMSGGTGVGGAGGISSGGSVGGVSGGRTADDRGRSQQQSQQQQQQQQPYALSLISSQAVPTNAWRCQWNVTGTVLASSGDGGMVQLWKPDHEGKFQCVSEVRADLSQVSAAAVSSAPSS